MLGKIADLGLTGERPVFFFSSQLDGDEVKEVAQRVDLILTSGGSILQGEGMSRSGTRIVNLLRLGSDPEYGLGDLQRWIARREREKGRQVSLQIQKIQPARYKISVELYGDARPFWLILPETYHPAWRAYIRDTYTPGEQEPPWAIEQWFRNRGSLVSPLLHHYPVNGYANAWYVDGQGRKRFDVILDFCWQLRFELGVLITLCMAAGGTVWWGIVQWKTRRHE